MYYTDNKGNYLMHHGVPGQKWGTRRYQNADGSLTAEGRLHYGVGNGNAYSGTNKVGTMAKERFNHNVRNFAGKYGSRPANEIRTASAYGKAAGKNIATAAKGVGSMYGAVGRGLARSASTAGKAVGRNVLDGSLHSFKTNVKEFRNTAKENFSDLANTSKTARSNLKTVGKEGRRNILNTIKENVGNTAQEKAARKQASKEFTQNFLSEYGEQDVRRFKRASRAGGVAVASAIVALGGAAAITGAVRESRRNQPLGLYNTGIEGPTLNDDIDYSVAGGSIDAGTALQKRRY